jgi:hypothetical protein
MQALWSGRSILAAALLIVFNCGLVQAQSGVASYSVTFEALWSAQTHPQEFPTGAHFSALVGTVHTQDVTLWAPGELASDGLRDVAEIGSQFQLADEIDQLVLAGHSLGLLLGTGFFLPGSDNVTFDVYQPYTRLSLVNMIAPSPDWFTGVASVDLVKNGDWVRELVVEVFPYDAGTDSGLSYYFPDIATVPAVAVSRITGFPFDLGGSVAPVGRFLIRRTDLPSCDFELSQATYTSGDVFGAQAWTLANPDNEGRAIELKVWLELSDAAFPLLSLGADGTFVLPAGFDLDLGALPLIPIDSSLPAGTYELNCRLVDPVTGAELSLDENPAQVQ